MLTDEIVEAHKPIVLKHFSGEILEYAVGIKYTYCVVVEDNKYAMGLAFTQHPDVRIGTIAEKPEIPTVFDRYGSVDILSRTLFLSCINAISQHLLWNKEIGRNHIKYFPLIDYIVGRIENIDNVVIIGNMVPLVRRIRRITDKVYVFERDPFLRIEGALPDYLEFRYLEDADVVIMTGVTLLNDTLDPIMKYIGTSALRIIVGPTAQLLPDILLKYFDVVASLKVDIISSVAEVLRRGGGRHSISKYCTDYVATKE